MCSFLLFQDLARATPVPLSLAVGALHLGGEFPVGGSLTDSGKGDQELTGLWSSRLGGCLAAFASAVVSADLENRGEASPGHVRKTLKLSFLVGFKP